MLWVFARFGFFELFFIVFVIVAVVVNAVGTIGNGKDRELEEAAARLRQQGYSVIEEIPKAPSFPFSEFSSHRDGETKLHITAPGTLDTAFRFTYTYKTDDGTRTVQLGCAVVPVPFLSPGISIWKGARSILGVVSGNRVDTDSERFNSLYEVECNDERFAYTLMSYEVIEWFLSDLALGSGVTVRIRHNWMLLVRNNIRYEELPGMLTMAQMLRSRLPEVLTSMYPLPPQM